MMTTPAFALILIGVLLNASAQLALKASVGDIGVIAISSRNIWPTAFELMSEVWLWVGLLCYGVSVIVWIMALSRVDVSTAYPMLSIGYVVNAIAAWALLGESFNPEKIAGIGIIVFGVIILGRS